MPVCLVTAPTATDFEDAGEALSLEVRQVASDPHLGVLSLAGVLQQAGIPVHVVDLNREYYRYLDQCGSGLEDFAPWAGRVILASGAEVIGLSSICSSYPLTIRIAKYVKQHAPDSTIILGGPQASIVDLETLRAFPFVDFVIRGEAEHSLLCFLDQLQGGRNYSAVGGLSYRGPFGPVKNQDAPLIEDLDTLPPPAYSVSQEMRNSSSAALELGRGCPFACTFCSTNDFFRRKFRLKSPGRMLQDMRTIAAEYGIREFRLVHDMFTVDRRRVEAFCRAMIASGEGFAWTCSARTDCVDSELLQLMAESGCNGIFFGIETGSQRLQRVIDKDLDVSQARRIVAEAERLGIRTTVSLITGFPEENEEDLRETASMYIDSLRHPHSQPQLNVLAPLAGTPVYAQHRHELALGDLCSEMSHQGRIQNEADRELIAKYPAIFPNFYLVPTPHLDRAAFLEFREFMLMGSVRLRWLLVALHRSRNIFDVFQAWRRCRIENHPELAGGELRGYYTREIFQREFLGFARCRQAEYGGPALAALLNYYDSLLDAQAADAGLPRHGKPLTRIGRSGSIPVRARNVHVLELENDIQQVIEALKRGEEPCRSGGRKLYRTDPLNEETTRLIEISPLLGRALESCNGRRTAKELVSEIAACFSGPRDLRQYAAKTLLEGMHSQGLVEVYRAAG